MAKMEAKWYYIIYNGKRADSSKEPALSVKEL